MKTTLPREGTETNRAILVHLVSRCVKAAWLFACAATAPAGIAAQLGITGTRFTLDSQPTFLLGASYYGALGAPEDFIQRDLDDLQRAGFNWIRVWATWGSSTDDVSAVDGAGNARQPFLGKLRWLVGECDRRSMVVDVTLSRGSARLSTLEPHRQAVETLVNTLKAYRNWYLDLGNERNIRDSRFVSIEDLRQLGDTVRRLDPKRLVTASHAGGELEQKDVREYLVDAQLDFLAPHRPRERGSAVQTEAKTKEVFEWMKLLGRSVPINYQEPFRRGYSAWQPATDDFSTDLVGAKHGGAAGWCFHNGDTRGSPGGEPCRSFDLSRRRLFEQLDDEERRFIASLSRPATDSFAISRQRMVAEQLSSPGRNITNARVLRAMEKVPRHEFVPANLRSHAYQDGPLPIGHGQTISQPFIVAFMTEQLDPKPADSVLEIGTGSGYQAAVLAELVAKVYTIEIIEDLAKRSATDLKRLGYTNVLGRCGDGYKGWPEAAPFDAIIVTCSPEKVPTPLTEQLKDGGRMIIPVGPIWDQELVLLQKRGGKLERRAVLPVRFVPMTGQSQELKP